MLIDFQSQVTASDVVSFADWAFPNVPRADDPAGGDPLIEVICLKGTGSTDQAVGGNVDDPC